MQKPEKLRSELKNKKGQTKVTLNFEPMKELNEVSEICAMVQVDEKRRKTYIYLVNCANRTRKILKGTNIGNLKINKINKKESTEDSKRSEAKQIEVVRNSRGELCDAEGTPFKISTNLSENERKEIESLIIKYYDVFTIDPLNI